MKGEGKVLADWISFSAFSSTGATSSQLSCFWRVPVTLATTGYDTFAFARFSLKENQNLNTHFKHCDKIIMKPPPGDDFEVWILSFCFKDYVKLDFSLVPQSNMSSYKEKNS